MASLPNEIGGTMDGRSLNTLDEPVMETIKRDLNAIGEKLYYDFTM